MALPKFDENSSDTTMELEFVNPNLQMSSTNPNDPFAGPANRANAINAAIQARPARRDVRRGRARRTGIPPRRINHFVRCVKLVSRQQVSRRSPPRDDTVLAKDVSIPNNATPSGLLQVIVDDLKGANPSPQQQATLDVATLENSLLYRFSAESRRMVLLDRQFPTAATAKETSSTLYLCVDRSLVFRGNDDDENDLTPHQDVADNVEQVRDMVDQEDADHQASIEEQEHGDQQANMNVTEDIERGRASDEQEDSSVQELNEEENEEIDIGRVGDELDQEGAEGTGDVVDLTARSPSSPGSPFGEEQGERLNVMDVVGNYVPRRSPLSLYRSYIVHPDVIIRSWQPEDLNLTYGRIDTDYTDRGFDIPDALGGRIGRACRIEQVLRRVLGSSTPVPHVWPLDFRQMCAQASTDMVLLLVFRLCHRTQQTLRDMIRAIGADSSVRNVYFWPYEEVTDDAREVAEYCGSTFGPIMMLLAPSGHRRMTHLLWFEDHIPSALEVVNGLDTGVVYMEGLRARRESIRQFQTERQVQDREYDPSSLAAPSTENRGPPNTVTATPENPGRPRAHIIGTAEVGLQEEIEQLQQAAQEEREQTEEPSNTVGNIIGTASVGLQEPSNTVGNIIGTASVGLQEPSNTVGNIIGTASVGLQEEIEQLQQAAQEEREQTEEPSNTVGNIIGTASVGLQEEIEQLQQAAQEEREQTEEPSNTVAPTRESNHFRLATLTPSEAVSRSFAVLFPHHGVHEREDTSGEHNPDTSNTGTAPVGNTNNTHDRQHRHHPYLYQPENVIGHRTAWNDQHGVQRTTRRVPLLQTPRIPNVNLANQQQHGRQTGTRRPLLQTPWNFH
ncbi:uncharacterized protein LOC144878273 [Branchiostoma floridae x Branchiostoma japonicum]